ncbi:MAG: 4-hydroxyphenylacetate 3-hydroxylase N-terminal domain-containing protein, partial [Pseudomonadales bacterium]
MMTGKDYKASLDDGRETYFEGEQIANVAEHPLLGQTVESAAKGYDRFYDPTPGAVGAFMKVPDSAAALREQVELHETVDLLTHVTYASIMTLLTAADRIEADLPENAARIRAYVDQVQKADLRITQCITDSKGDRSKRPGDQAVTDAYVHVTQRNAEGIVISGVKAIVTGGPYMHELLVMPC